MNALADAAHAWRCSCDCACPDCEELDRALREHEAADLQSDRENLEVAAALVILAHAYEHDSRPPDWTLEVAKRIASSVNGEPR